MCAPYTHTHTSCHVDCAGNPEADQDIIRFYIAKQQLLAKLHASSIV